MSDLLVDERNSDRAMIRRQIPYQLANTNIEPRQVFLSPGNDVEGSDVTLGQLDKLNVQAVVWGVMSTLT